MREALRIALWYVIRDASLRSPRDATFMQIHRVSFMFIPKRRRRSAQLCYLDESRHAHDSGSNSGLSAGGLLFTVHLFVLVTLCNLQALFGLKKKTQHVTTPSLKERP